MSWLKDCVICVDVGLLRAVRAAVEFADEWLALRQRWMEWGFAAGYGASWIALDVLSRDLKWLAFLPLVLLWCVGRVRKPDAARAAWIASAQQIFLRISTLALSALLCGLVASAFVERGWRWVDVAALLTVATNTAFVFMSSLPASGGNRRGRKAKLALAKLKEMFGTGWMPLPAGGHCMQRGRCQ